jgi:hypothetical protein
MSSIYRQLGNMYAVLARRRGQVTVISETVKSETVTSETVTFDNCQN